MTKFHTSFKSTFLLFTFTILSILVSQAQENNPQTSDSTQVIDITIKINDIPEETERLGQRIIKLKEILKPSSNISEVDSLLVIAATEINRKKDSLYIELNEITRRDLKIKKVAWLSYRTRLKEYNEVLKTRTEDISEINDEIVQEILKWEKTRDKLLSNSDSKDIYQGLDNVLETLQDISGIVHKRLDSVFIVQSGLTEIVLKVDEVISEIEITELQLQKDYFVFDSPPIWVSKKVDTTKVAINKAEEKLSVKQTASNTFNENTEQLKEFISLNKFPFIMQILFILFLFILIRRVNNNWNKDINELTNPIEIQSKIVLTNPLASSLVAGLLVSFFFYDTLIPIYGEIHIILILLGTCLLYTSPSPRDS